jgi:glycosyltransferase involved in cell wall biosynthesis
MGDTNLPLVSVVVPALNESACVDELARRLSQVFDSETAYEWEACIVENGSTDDTWQRLEAIHARDPRFKVLRLARNFGMDGGLTAGLDFVSGDACVFMTADLQDPPEMIHDFLRKWEEGHENVYAVITKRHGTSIVRSLNSRAFYWIAGKLTGNRIPRNASDFRLMDRRVYEAVRSMEERNRFVRGLVAWVGFDSIGIPLERPERFGGSSKAYSGHVLDLALRGVLAHSVLPLRLISIFGLVVSGAAVLGFLVSLGLWLTRGVPFGGFGTIVSLILLLFGSMSFMIGIVSEYVGLIYEEVRRRPNYIVSSSLGF